MLPVALHLAAWVSLVGAGWAFCPPDFREKGPYPWVSEEAKQAILREDGTGTPMYAIQAKDGARVILARESDDETAQKIIEKADPFIEAYQEKFTFNIENVRMPEDKNPDDAALHQQMQAA